MATLSSLVNYLDSLLEVSKYKDYGLNGLQVEAKPNHEISKVAVAVDAGESVIDKAIAAEADLLIVHHGLIWGSALPFTGALGRKLSKLFDANCSLYGAHLPLDGNMEVGNAVELARILEMTDIQPAFDYKGMTIGVICKVPQNIVFDDIIEKASTLSGFQHPTNLLFGPPTPKHIGIATGSASSLLNECKELGLDTLISGEPKQEAFHNAKELGLNALFLGHYATETTGVKALAKRLEKDLDIGTVFIDEPTGI